MLATKFQMSNPTRIERAPKTPLQGLRFFSEEQLFTQLTKHVKSLSRKIPWEGTHQKVWLYPLMPTSHSSFSSVFKADNKNIFFFCCFWKFIKQLHKHCLFVQLHSSTMVKRVSSGLRETTSTDGFHHRYSTRNVTRKEGSVAREFLLLGHPGCRKGPGNTQTAPWQYMMDYMTDTRITEEFKCLILIVHTLSCTALWA